MTHRRSPLDLSLARRGFLGALGLGAASLVLPSLVGRGRVARAAPPTPPRRLVIVHSGHGQVYDRWKIRAGAPAGPDYGPNDWTAPLGSLAKTDFSPTLMPFYDLRKQLLVVDGLVMHTAITDPSDTNGHQTGGLTSLTGSWQKPNNCTDSPSIDQLIAQQNAPVGGLRSIEIETAGGSISNYDGAIRNLEGKPVPAESDPAVIWKRLFGNLATTPPGPPSDDDLFAAARSQAVGVARGEHDLLSKLLSGDDRKKLETHRDLMSDLAAKLGVVTPTSCSPPKSPGSPMLGTKDDFHLKAQLVAAAFSCDATRVVTIQHGGPSLAELGEPAGDFHQDYAHHCDDGTLTACGPSSGQPNAKALDVATKYHTFDAGLVADLANLLGGMTESDGSSVLDNTVIVWCGELANGGHGYATWPVVLLGGGALGLKPGRVAYYGQTIATACPYAPETKLGPAHNRLWISIANALGLPIKEFGRTQVAASKGGMIDCTGALAGLT